MVNMKIYILPTSTIAVKEPQLVIIKKFERQLLELGDLDTDQEEKRKPGPNTRIHAGHEYGLDFELEYSLAEDNKVSYRRNTVFVFKFLDGGLL